MYTLENELLKVTFKKNGAEMTDIFHKKTNLHYLHDGNPMYWNRHAPVLFPIVGRLKDNTYTYEGKEYTLPQHGFARDLDFEVVDKTDSIIDFVLKSNEKTKENYPFDFVLHLIYELKDGVLSCTYLVENPSASKTLYFSVGGHPAFRVPLEENLTFEDYTLLLNEDGNRKRYQLTGPYIDLEKTTDTSKIRFPLNYELFKNDALIFGTKNPQNFTISSTKGNHGLRFYYNEFSFVGFWTPYGKNAPFLCIEPWCGIADTTDASGELSEKLGIEKLLPHKEFKKTFKMEFF